MASLPNAPWSGRDLASASQTAQTDAQRSRREMELAAAILAATCPCSAAVCPYLCRPFVSASLRGHGSDAGAVNGDAAACAGFALFLLSEKKRPTFPSAAARRNSGCLQRAHHTVTASPSVSSLSCITASRSRGGGTSPTSIKICFTHEEKSSLCTITCRIYLCVIITDELLCSSL